MEQTTVQNNETVEVKDQDNRFYKIRNTGKCLSEGVSLLTENFLRMLFLSLPVSIPYAVSSAILAMVATNLVAGVTTEKIIMFSVFSSISFLTLIGMLALVYRFVEVRIADENLGKQTLNSIYNRRFFALTLKSLFYVIITAVLICIAVGLLVLYTLIGSKEMDLDKTTLKIVGLVLILLIFLTFAIAYRNVLPTVMLQKGSYLRSYLDGLKRGFRKWGKMMQISVLVFILVGVVSFLLSAPAIVFTFVQSSALASQLNGDAVNLPEHFETWMFITLLVTEFVTFFITMVYFSPLSFTYASIMTEEEEAEGAIPMV
ncbi:MAG: hypothetical protein IKH26_09090 [Bacteroidaceae bacterium]|nr:hypothetical protein [Bacteroidaceae bacterium]